MGDVVGSYERALVIYKVGSLIVELKNCLAAHTDSYWGKIYGCD